ncbi:MAG TPA: class I SAM-dependent methyltransferase [Sporichthyaceae bacterium]|nr:class I SAM-dependent methyltransferase [Sporichthyaceae bacterium]
MLRSSVGRRGNYGVDTPVVPGVQAAVALMMFNMGFDRVGARHDPQGWWLIGSGSVLMVIALTYLHASRRGKFRVWSRALGELNLVGTERALDLGCGRGAVTTLVAARLPRGSVLGIDSWRSRSRLTSNRGGTEDQIARHNAELEGVAKQVEYKQGDITDLGIPGNQFDLVVSGLGISAVHTAEGRRAAVDQAVRVACPGGRLLIADIRYTKEYAARLAELGCEQVESRSLGWETWYGGPWLSTILVSARKSRA